MWSCNLPKTNASTARKTGGHGGMDYLMEYHLRACHQSRRTVNCVVRDSHFGVRRYLTTRTGTCGSGVWIGTGARRKKGCLDWYAGILAGGSDPSGAVSGSRRVSWGGSWDSAASDCRSASRSNDTPSGRYNHIGFRLVRTLP